MQYVDVVVGGQYGSEAKGHVCAQLISNAVCNHPEGEGTELWNIRVAGPNAGHTAYDTRGNKYAFRSLPIGAIVDDRVQLYIAPGSELDLPVLSEEIALAGLGEHHIEGRLWISREATLIEQRHKDAEGAGADGANLVQKVGSTGKGIGAARADRILRNAHRIGDVLDDDALWARFGAKYAEPEDLYATDWHVHEKDQYIVIEGTQGYGLSFRASGNYPRVTTNDCRTVDFLAMAGIDPTRCNTQIQSWVVARVFPIRVAGNSGPMKGETTWEELGLEPELTTVTQKVRRVGEWDLDLVKRAVQANGGHNVKLVISMMDQVVPEFVEYAKTYDPEVGHIDPDHPAMVKATKWFEDNLQEVGTNLAAFTFSPTNIIWTTWAMEAPEYGQVFREAVEREIENITDRATDTLFEAILNADEQDEQDEEDN